MRKNPPRKNKKKNKVPSEKKRIAALKNYIKIRAEGENWETLKRKMRREKGA